MPIGMLAENRNFKNLIADYIITSVDEDGVKSALIHYNTI